MLAGLPLAFGGFEPRVLTASVAILAAALLWTASRDPLAQRSLRRVVHAVGALSLLAAWAWLQGAAGVSWAPSASRRVAALWLAVALALALGAVLGRSRRARRALLFAYIGGAVVQAIYGVTHWSKGASDIFGVPVASQPQRLKGAFVNPNHFALLAVLALLGLHAWIWWGLRQVREHERRRDAPLLVVLPVALWGLVLAALLLSGSRSGLLALAVGGGVQALAVSTAAQRGRGMRSMRRLLGGVLIVSLALLLVGSVAVILEWRVATERILSTTWADVSLGSRFLAWGASTKLLALAPVLLVGVGFGAFSDAFPRVADARLAGVAWEHVHNDWLELLVCGGLLGLALAACAIVPLVRRMVRVWVGGRRSEDRAAGLFACGALAAAGVQEVFEFALLAPGNSISLALLIGAAAGALSVGAAGSVGSVRAGEGVEPA